MLNTWSGTINMPMDFEVMKQFSACRYDTLANEESVPTKFYKQLPAWPILYYGIGRLSYLGHVVANN